MRTLVIDSATESCSVALIQDGVVIAGDCAILGRGHAERLVPMIATLPDKGRADVIAVDIGPGSFTGIRVGLAAARALAMAWGAKLYGYESLWLVAVMAQAEHPGTAVDVSMTGGHGEWFFQPFGPEGTPAASMASIAPNEAILRSTAAIIAGSQAGAIAQVRTAALAIDLRPDARCFALLPTGALLDAPRPSYGRAPDARLPVSA